MLNYFMSNNYFVIIEPVYSQGVGNYTLFTDKIDNINKFRLELLKYKNYLKEKDDIEHWEFYEYVFKITEIKKTKDNSYTYVGTLVFRKDNCGDYDFVESNYIENKNDLPELVHQDDRKFKINYVYNNFDNSKKPCKIEFFDILKS